MFRETLTIIQVVALLVMAITCFWKAMITEGLLALILVKLIEIDGEGIR